MTELTNEKITAKPVDAATVILVRQAVTDNQSTLQTLLLCRGNSRTVMNKAWVFPGGKVDPHDLTQVDTVQSQLLRPATELLNEPQLSQPMACALFHAACRETFEETGVELKPDALQTWSRWTTPTEPSMMKKRFDARFFIAAMPQNQTAKHDGQEATDSQWLSPELALQQYIENKLVLAPPQIMSLLALAPIDNVDDALALAQNTPAYHIQPHVIKSENSRILIYPGDKEHPDQIKKMPGPTRLIWKENYFAPPQGYESFFT